MVGKTSATNGDDNNLVTTIIVWVINDEQIAFCCRCLVELM